MRRNSGETVEEWMVMIPCADIIERADRRWTALLLDRLEAAALPDDELDDLVGALQAVSDPRSLGPLESIVCDGNRPAAIRRAASSVLRGMRYLVADVPEERLRRWWAEGDDVLRRHALLCMDAVDCPDIVLQVAREPGHPLYAEALGRMEFFFDLPEHEAIKIAALAHPDAWVREVAAYVLLWDEPVAAELPLVEATRDPVPAVAAEAANTLEYYPTVRVMRRLHGMLGHADDRVREAVDDSWTSIRNELLIRLCDRDRRVTEHIGRWLRPVWDILAFSEEELSPDEDGPAHARNEECRKALPMSDLLALLADPDASPMLLERSFQTNDWGGYDEEERRRIRPVLLTHPDQVVRERAAWAFAAWADADGLLELSRDTDVFVRKSAMYRLGQLPPMPSIADLAWDHLHRHDTLGVHATETLDTFVRHADPSVAIRRLAWVAGDHGRREGLRIAAVDHLGKLGAVTEVGQLTGLLLEPPAVTWALHVALLAAVADLGLPTPNVGHLREVDNLHVQEAVARLEA